MHFPDYNELQERVTKLELENARVHATVGTLIVWITQSANASLSKHECDVLLNKLVGVDVK